MAIATTYKYLPSQWIALISILITNFIFAWKYLDRISPSAALAIALGYAFILLLVTLFWPKIHLPIPSHWLILATGIVIVVFSYFVFQNIDPWSVKVDRWSVISSFWDAVFNGEYPYFAESHMGAPPGPLPVYFLLGLPFYLMGELGWYAVFGILLFLWFIHQKRNEIHVPTVLILTFCSLAILYEILVRSTIFTNSVLFLIFLDRIKSFEQKKIKSILFIGFIAGILLSTRIVYGMCFAVYLIHGLRTKQISFRNAFLWGLASIVGLLLTILPVYLIYPSEFLIQNPFNIQGTYSMEPFWQPIFLAIAIWMGWVCKTNQRLHFMYGMCLFLILFIYVVYHFFTIGLEGLFNGRIDISYLLFSFPFLLYYFTQREHRTTDLPQSQ